MSILEKAKKPTKTKAIEAVVESTGTEAVETKRTAHGKRVLVRAVVSEKATIGEATGIYTFIVDNKATKIDVKNAVRTTYGVLPKMVRIVNVEGKKVRFGGFAGRRKDSKKAFVTLKPGTTIDIHAGV